MSTMNISLSSSMRAYVEEQVRLRHYSSGSEYMRDLIRKDQETREEKLRALETLLKDRLNAPHGAPMDEAYFARLKEMVLDHVEG